MKYSNIIADMTWSYSRITAFEMCPYKFLLTYILKKPQTPMFFAEYGKFMHSIIEKVLIGELDPSRLPDYYLENFTRNIIGKPPHTSKTKNLLDNYFNQGLAYCENFQMPDGETVAVEKRLNFMIGDKPFVGVIDRVGKTDTGYVITDHKSRTLKPRSTRKKPTLSDKELDEYLRQLYLYSIPVHQEYGEYPEKLQFNCFREQRLIDEDFKPEQQKAACDWAIQKIDEITEHEEWNPVINQFSCRYLCGVHKDCEYFNMFR